MISGLVEDKISGIFDIQDIHNCSSSTFEDFEKLPGKWIKIRWSFDEFVPIEEISGIKGLKKEDVRKVNDDKKCIMHLYWRMDFKRFPMEIQPNSLHFSSRRRKDDNKGWLWQSSSYIPPLVLPGLPGLCLCLIQAIATVQQWAGTLLHGCNRYFVLNVYWKSCLCAMLRDIAAR